MNPFVESLKRLLKDEKITEAKIKQLYADKKITKEQCDYILSKGE